MVALALANIGYTYIEYTLNTVYTYLKVLVSPKLAISQRRIRYRLPAAAVPRCVWVNAGYQTYSCSYRLVNTTVRQTAHLYFPYRTTSMRLNLRRDWLSRGADLHT